MGKWTPATKERGTKARKWEAGDAYWNNPLSKGQAPRQGTEGNLTLEPEKRREPFPARNWLHVAVRLVPAKKEKKHWQEKQRGAVPTVSVEPFSWSRDTRGAQRGDGGEGGGGVSSQDTRKQTKHSPGAVPKRSGACENDKRYPRKLWFLGRDHKV